MPKRVRIEVSTSQLSDNECYAHDIDLEDFIDLYKVIESIETLYGAEGVTSLHFSMAEEE